MKKLVARKDITNIVLTCLFSKMLYVFIAGLGYSIVPRFDKSTELIKNKSNLNFLLSWDAVHYLEIMEKGYTKEHLMAFFPLISCISRVFSQLLPFLNTFTVGILVSCLSFTLSALLLYKITLKSYDENIAKIACMLFIFNPASIIYTSMYSESTFMLFFLLGLHYKQENDEFNSILFFAISCFCRSNGILFSLFYLKPFHIIKTPLKIGFLGSLFALFQYFCLIKINFFKYMGVFVPYSYIQKKYWDQGFFKFYTVYNIPNILVGGPFLIMVFYIFYKNQPKFNLILKNRNLGKQEFYELTCWVILTIQTLMAIFIIHWNMYFRFISYNPIIYWEMAKIYLGEKNFIEKNLIRFFFGFGVAYSFLFGCFYPPC